MKIKNYKLFLESSDFDFDFLANIGKMKQAMKASGLRMPVMVTEFTELNQAKNIVVNGKMMSVTAKANGPKLTAQSFLETSEMICAMDYALCKIKGKEILN